MIKDIKCQTCGALIGTISKPEITEHDVFEYRQMVTCPDGHKEAELVTTE